jgi:general stress protein 26
MSDATGNQPTKDTLDTAETARARDAQRGDDSSHGTHRAGHLDHVRAIMKKVRVCMLTTTAPDGRLHSHPMTTQESEFDGDAWFIVDRQSETATNVTTFAEVNLAYAGSSDWLSVAGTASLVEDQAKVEELWNPFADAWFEGGKDDPRVVLLRVKASEAQYWDNPGRVRMTLSMLTASATDNPPKQGESHTVDLT